MQLTRQFRAFNFVHTTQTGHCEPCSNEQCKVFTDRFRDAGSLVVGTRNVSLVDSDPSTPHRREPLCPQSECTPFRKDLPHDHVQESVAYASLMGQLHSGQLLLDVLDDVLEATLEKHFYASDFLFSMYGLTVARYVY